MTTTTRERILALAPDHHIAEIARIVGVSHQWVSQVLMAAGVVAAQPPCNESAVLERTKALRRLASEGCSLKQAAAALGISSAALHRWRQRHGLSDLRLKHGHVRQAQIDKIKRLAIRGFTKAQIAGQLGLSYSAVVNCATRHLPGVKFKDGRKQRSKT